MIKLCALFNENMKLSQKNHKCFEKNNAMRKTYILRKIGIQNSTQT